MFLVSYNQIHYSKDSNWGEIIHYQLTEGCSTGLGLESASESIVRPRQSVKFRPCQEALSSRR